MPHDEVTTNAYQPSKQPCPSRPQSLAWLIAASSACASASLIGGLVVLHAIWKILSTTNVFGIAVDAKGNRIPTQGYGQFALGMLGTTLCIVLAVYFALLAHERWRSDVEYDLE